MAIPRAGTELAIEESAPLDAITSRVIYTSDFGDLPLGINGTEDPGYDTQVGVLLPGSLLGVQATGTLEYWDNALAHWPVGRSHYP